MSKIPDTSLSDQIELLRVRLEAMLPLPMFLMLSSARPEDGKGIVASALARSMEAAGYSTLLVVADERSHVETAPTFKSLDALTEAGIAQHLLSSRSGHQTLILPSTGLRRTASRESVIRFSSICRTSFQVTIVDGASALDDSFSMLTAVASDGVLLTVKEGRRVMQEDRLLARAVASDGISFLGVITVADAIIRRPSTSVAEPTLSARPTRPTVNTDIEARTGQPV